MSGARTGHPPASTIPDVLATAARRFGDQEAVVDGAERRTFSQVAALAEEVQRALMASGVAPGDRVAIWAPNGLAWVIVSFAVYACGAVLVPVNTRFRAGEAIELLDKVRPRLVLTVTDFLGTSYAQPLLAAGAGRRDAAAQVLTLEETAPVGATPWPEFLGRAGDVDAGQARARSAAVAPQDPSDIVFTSGTTGLPKGAVLRHGASVETYRQWSGGVGLRPGDRMLVVYPFFHTAGLKSGVLAAFLRGVTLVPHAVFDVPSVAARVAEEAITVLPGPPSVFQSILNHPDFDSFSLGSLRLSVTGAAVVPVELIARMRRQLALESVITAYGLTETHGTVTICEQSDPVETIATTVGHPLEGLELKVVADDGTAVPTGAPGEVLVRGFNVMSGYYRDPEATAQAIGAEGWLHTGDVGVLRPDGYLRIVDRKKDILIVGGFNVSAAEVEAVLLRRSDVAQAAVVAAPDERLGEVAAAFVVPTAGAAPDPGELIEWCRDQMAHFKAPRYARLVEALPTNASGKVLKAPLRDEARRLWTAAP